MTTKNLGPKGQCACRYLLSKEMFYEDNPKANDKYSSGIFWCELTHNAIGPDGAGVDDLECAAGRECYEE